MTDRSTSLAEGAVVQRAPSLARVPIQAEHYQADLELLDRYQGYSAELLRLSLLGMTAYGFLLDRSGWLGAGEPTSISAGLAAFVVGVAAMAVSAGAALGHRYVSTDSFCHLLTLFRLNADGRSGDERYGREREEMRIDLKRSERMLYVSAFALGLGILAVAATFFSVLLP